MKLENNTDRAEPATKRRYDDACGTAHGLELVGDRWALLIVRELMFGPKRFGDIRASLPGISANVLTQRLEELERNRILDKRRLPPPVSASVYALTPWGEECEEVIKTLGRWAARSPTHDPTLPLSAASLMLSFRTMLDTERSAGIDALIGFRLGGEVFAGRLAAGDFAIRRGDPGGSDLILTGDPTAIAAVVYGGAPMTTIGVEGDEALAARFVTLFPLPPKAA
jgi:DNA-binding HxlR family transcriptional regulator